MSESVPDSSGIDFRRAALPLLDSITCGAIVFERAGRICAVNAKLGALLGRSSADLVGRPMRELYPDDEGRAWMDQALAGFNAPGESEGYLPLPGGRRLPVMLSGGPLVGPGAPSDQRILFFLDISKQKQAEESLQQRYTDIAQLSDTVLEQALSLKDYSKTLEQRVRERTEDLRLANMDAIYMLAVASEAKDVDTGAHVRRIQHSAESIARVLGMAEHDAERIGFSAILHDVGKMQIPDEILKKPGPLSPEERAVMEQHTVAGERILSNRPFFEIARHIARSHHENWDGSGYPDRLAGADIPLPARIVHVADVYDALVSSRVYKPGWSPESAARNVESGRGHYFDPYVVDAFLQVYESGGLPPVESVNPAPALAAGAK